MYEARNYGDIVGMNGLSENALKNHFKLYQGYVANTNKIRDQLSAALKDGSAGTPFYAELKRRFGWEFDGMRLHELYFENMMKGSSQIDKSSTLFGWIVKSFGSFENWEKDFRATAAMRGIGWVVLYHDVPSKRLFNAWINEHDSGHLAGAAPILVMDVFEHAYMPDYGLAKADYIDAFFKAIDWNVAYLRLENMSAVKWDEMPAGDAIEKTAEAIRSRGIEVIVADSKKMALEAVVGMIPQGSTVSFGTSTTLHEIGFVDYLKSGKHGWRNLKDEIVMEKDAIKQADLRRMADAAEYFLGSVNAIASTGELVACDATGSRVSAYPFAAKKVILVAGAQKITHSLSDAMRRVREHVYPMEDKRALKAYGAHSAMGKWVVIERELMPKRMTLIIVREKLGF